MRIKSQQAGLEADKLQKKVDDLQHFSELERQVCSLIKPQESCLGGHCKYAPHLPVQVTVEDSARIELVPAV